MLGRKKKKEKERRFAEEALIHMDSLHGGAVYLTKNPSEAEDLVQDTFLKAYRNFEKYQEGTNCRAWLYRIMTNTFLNNKRRSKRIDSFVSAEAPGDYEAYQNNPSLLAKMDPEASFVSRNLSPVVKEALSSLPEDFRAAVILCDLQDFSYKEVAEILNCPTGTVMSRIYRGRQLLKRRLVKHAVEQGILPEEQPVQEGTSSLEAFRARKQQENA